MPNLAIPPLVDILRLPLSDVATTAEELAAWYSRPPGAFNYQPAKRLAGPALSHAAPLPALEFACATSGAPAGRRQNLEVVQMLWAAGEGRSLRFVDLKPGAYSIRRDMAVPLSATGFYTERGVVRLLWLQPRRTLALDLERLGMMCAILRAVFARDGLDEAVVEILDLSAPGGRERQMRILHEACLPVPTSDVVGARLQVFADAYDSLVASGFQKPARPRPQPPQGPDLFQ
jgi:hypothetical protein